MFVSLLLAVGSQGDRGLGFLNLFIYLLAEYREIWSKSMATVGILHIWGKMWNEK